MPKKTTPYPGRPREFDESEILSRIMQLFWENGYEGTGLSDILKVTGLGKASLYATFGNKQAMYLKALAHYEEIFVNAAVQALTHNSTPAQDRLHSFLMSPITAIEEKGDRKGCFLCNASADRSSLDEETAKLVRRGYTKMHNALAKTISELQDTKDDEETTKAKASLALSVYSGLRVMARSGVAVETLLAAVDACLSSLCETPQRKDQSPR